MASDPQAQPVDDRSLITVFLDREILELALDGFKRYRPQLERIRGVEVPFRLERSPSAQEMERLDRMIAWCEARLLELGMGQPGFYEMTYRSLKWIKAGMLLEVGAMKEERRRLFSQHQAMPISVVEAINSKISSLENLTEQGFFNGMSPVQLIVGHPAPMAIKVEVADAVPAAPVPPTVVMRIELMDSELRRRCGDLFEQFAANSQDQDRFDTVLREASTLVEDRIRAGSGLAPTLHGLELVSQALARDKGELILSDDPSEQEGAHLLFRGFFSFVRNTVAHRLVPTYTTERAAQVLGMADYLLFLLSQARRRNPPPPTAVPAP